jgi:D-alanine--poly(phosphoribitol) ligase subunit 1
MAFVSNLWIAFEEIATTHRDRPALFYAATGQRVNYSDLHQLAQQSASSLLERGLGIGSVVAMFHDKSPAAFAMILACLRLGVTYTMLDPDSPWPRLQKILSSSCPNLIVNAFELMPHRESLVTGGYAHILNLRELDASRCSRVLPEASKISGATPAYIMFTSGSTGNPKGAVMSHANVLWFIQWSRHRFNITPDDVLTNANPIYFDNSVFDFYSAIFSGATLVPLTAEQVRDPRQLVRYVNEAKCSIWFSVPSLLVYLLTTRALAAKDFPSIRKIIFGGEGFPKVKLKQLYDLFGHRAELENVYGPTECTCICSAHTIGPADFDDMQSLATLGALSQNFDHEILPQDATDPSFGELLLRGPQVGLGYYNDLGRTQAAFIQNPTHNRFSDIGYRTGDLVKLDTNGNLHFKGRVDYQIKHMGYRIELEEVEAAIGTISHIKECAVIYQKLGDGLGQILAYVATSEQTPPTTVIEQVGKLLPAYMVPRDIRILDALPKNANGKIDRVALKALAESPTNA